jgi:hypothetical protein
MMLLLHLGLPELGTLTSLGPWLGLAALGAFHGLNPAMGWLFALALGLQRRSEWAIVRALVFITAGHAASVLLVAGILFLMGAFVPLRWVRLASGGVLLVFGMYKLFRYYRHPRWVGMQVGARDLFMWSFLMASAHGAGLMLAPIILGMPTSFAASSQEDLAHHSEFIDLSDTSAVWGLGLGVHTMAMLLVMLPIALVVYKKVGLAFLRRGWINVDVLWGCTLILAGVLTVLVTEV